MEEVSAARGKAGQLRVIDFLIAIRRLADVREERRSPLDVNGSEIPQPREIKSVVLLVHQLFRMFAQGQHCRFAQIKEDFRRSPGAYSGGNPDGFGRPRAGARIGSDDEEESRNHSIKAQKPIRAGNQIVYNAQPCECGQVAHRNIPAPGRIRAREEIQATSFEGLQVFVGETRYRLIDAIEINLHTFAERGFSQAQGMAKASVLWPDRHEQA